jgi:hypothetical protein
MSEHWRISSVDQGENTITIVSDTRHIPQPWHWRARVRVAKSFCHVGYLLWPKPKTEPWDDAE